MCMATKQKPRDLTEDVYEWELSVNLFEYTNTPTHQLTLDECRALAVDACTSEHFPPPYHISGEPHRLRDNCAWCEHSSRCLGFPEGGPRQSAIVLHEVAHYVTRHGHDEVFLRKYIELLDRFGVQEARFLEATAREAGLL